MRFETTPFEGQRPGTSGLRKKTPEFMQPRYLENFVQSIFNATGGAAGKTFVLGGDGRYFASEAARTIIRMAAANGAARVIVGRGALLSTPAASHLIRLRGADAGLLLSASHNPGGKEGDFGVKYNVANGGPAPENVTEAIFRASQILSEYFVDDGIEPNMDQMGIAQIGAMVLEVVDPVWDYANWMESIFDFNAVRGLFHGGFTVRIDCMNAVNGPYAQEIFERRLHAPAGSVIRATPLADFGGAHPDPNPLHAHALVREMMGQSPPDFAAATDGDGDRNMILGRGTYVSPSDSLAVLAANAHLVPRYREGLRGVARSMPTSGAVDRVAAALAIACYETPTGWKYFGNLLDAGRVTLCGEESFGTGSDHLREKDGLWAVLMWLNIIAVRAESVAEILRQHWLSYGRNYYSRHDYEALPAEPAEALVAELRGRLRDLPGKCFAGLRITDADEFSYHDPIDASLSRGQGLRLLFEGDSRIVLRLSGTGTQGATLRLYYERYIAGPDRLDAEPQTMLAPLFLAAEEILGLRRHLRRSVPDAIT